MQVIRCTWRDNWFQTTSRDAKYSFWKYFPWFCVSDSNGTRRWSLSKRVSFCLRAIRLSRSFAFAFFWKHFSDDNFLQLLLVPQFTQRPKGSSNKTRHISDSRFLQNRGRCFRTTVQVCSWQGDKIFWAKQNWVLKMAWDVLKWQKSKSEGEKKYIWKWKLLKFAEAGQKSWGGGVITEKWTGRKDIDTDARGSVRTCMSRSLLLGVTKNSSSWASDWNVFGKGKEDQCFLCWGSWTKKRKIVDPWLEKDSCKVLNSKFGPETQVKLMNLIWVFEFSLLSNVSIYVPWTSNPRCCDTMLASILVAHE